MRMRQVAGLSAAASLDEPTRRSLYEFVVRQQHAVSRDEAAAAVGAPRSTVAFHLDRLVEAGLLDVLHERRSGRRGPGAGRPAKLYRRAACDVNVSLPERRYDLVGALLAAAIEEATRSDRPVDQVLERLAYERGRELAVAPDVTEDGPAELGGPLDAVLRVLEAHGYEPRIEGTDVALGNCPFHVLAREHTALVCGTNRSLLAGVLDALGPTGYDAHLRPRPTTCCVRLVPEQADA